MLEIELPEFPHAVIYQQAAVLPGPGPSPLAAVQVWHDLRRNPGTTWYNDDPCVVGVCFALAS